MKTTLKIFLILTTLLFLTISIYYGLRISHTPYTYEYLNNSLVVTIPNKLWFEIDNQQDYTTKESINTYIFENDISESSRTGYDIGISYPIYTAKTENKEISKTDIITRQKDTLTINRNMYLKNSTESDTYTSRITFSEFGTFKDSTYTQDGCSVKIDSQNGDIRYDEKTASADITYASQENITDIINITISCLGL